MEERPPDFEHHGIEGRRGEQKKPLARAERRVVLVLHQPHHAAMGDRHTLRLAGGARRIDDISGMLRARGGRQVMVRVPRNFGPLDIQTHRAFSCLIRQVLQEMPLSQNHLRLDVIDHKGKPLARRRGVERHVSGPRLQDAQLAHHQFDRALGANRHPLFRSNPARPQEMGEAIGPAIQLAIIHCRTGQHQRRRRATLRRHSLEPTRYRVFTHHTTPSGPRLRRLRPWRILAGNQGGNKQWPHGHDGRKGGRGIHALLTRRRVLPVNLTT